jgi:MYXO-CTERM domain-containing protein
MLRRLAVFVLLVLSTAAEAQTRGVPQNGFPTWQERMIYVYTNRSRCDPVTELAGCAACAEKACYSTPLQPVIWNYNLNRAARFHSAELEYTGCFQHDSPGALVSNISSVYVPVGTCLGQASCAYSGGFTCGTAATNTFTRIAAFGTSGSSENIAYYGGTSATPQMVYNLWIFEADSNTACGFRSSNGHRYSILNGNNRALGAGHYSQTRSMYTQDFASSGTPTGSLITGGHDPQFTNTGTTNVNFRVNWYDTAGPQTARVNIDGVCTSMTMERGVTAANSTWLTTIPLTGTGCRRYAFQFTTAGGTTVMLPETGTYGVGGSLATCADYQATAPAACGTGNAAPTIAAAAAAAPNPVTGTTTNLSALGADDNGEAALTYTWSSTGPAAVTFSANGTNAAKASLATFTALGSYTLTVTVRDVQGLTATSNVTVNVNATLTSINVTPGSANVPASGTQQFTASGRDQFGAALSAQPSFTWTTSGGGTISTGGLYTAGATIGGPYSVTATSGAVSGSAVVNVVSGPPTVATAASATPNPVSATTTTLSALGADDGGEAALTYTWVRTSGPAVVTFSGNGTNAAKSTVATFTAAGSYVFTVTIRDAQNNSVTSSVTVTVNATLTSILVTPSSITIAPNANQQFTASARDQFGTALSSQPAITWSASGGGTINGSGRYNAGTTPGVFTITATSGAVSGTATVTIGSGTGPSVTTAATATPNPVSATTTALSVLGADDGGEAALTYTWSATGPATVTYSANGTNAAKNSTVTFSMAGSYTFTVTLRDAQNNTATSSVTVTVNATLTTVAVSPAATSVVASGTRAFTAQGSDQFGTVLASQPTWSWTVSGGGTISASGLFTAGATPGGPFTVTAASGGRSGTAQVTVTAGGPPTVATAASATPSTVSGTTAALSVLGADDGGEAGLSYTWSATGPASVTFSANGTNAAKATNVTFTRAGTYTFTVTIRDAGGQTVTSTVTVTVQQTLTSVIVTPPNATVAISGTLTFSAVARDQFSNALATAPAFTWTVSGGGTIVASSGAFTAGASAGGPFTVTATTGGVSGTAQVSVASGSAPTIATAAAATPNPVTSTSTEMSVLGADDGGEAALNYTWSATGPANVTFSANGTNGAKASTATFTAAGTYSFTVTIRDAAGLTTTSTVTVTVQQTAAAVAVVPGTATAPVGGTVTFAASASDQFGASMAPQPAFSWMVNGGGTISSAGVFSASSAGGPFTVTASTGGISGTASVTVTSSADTTPPTVAITAPADGATVSGLVMIAATAADDLAVARVDFFVDGTLIGSSTSAPYAVSWNSAGALAPAGHVLRARATDTSGNTADSTDVTVTVTANSADTTPPVVNVTAPSDGQAVTGRFTITARATDDVGVTRVVLLLDGVSLTSLTAAPYAVEFDASTLSLGDHVIVARAWDAAGNQAESPALRVVREPPEEVVGTCGCSSGAGALGWALGAFVVALRRRRRN